MLVRKLAVAIAVVWGALWLSCRTAGAVTLSIADTSVSETSTRDGRTLVLGYRITSDGDTDAQLTATLVGPVPSNDTVTDMIPAGVSVRVRAGTDWYYRSFLINLGPGASQGSNKYYSVTYTVNWGSDQTTSLTRSGILTMLSPISVRIPCLMYHKIGDALYSQYWNTVDMLTRQMAALKSYGYTSVTCRELMDYRAGLASPPAKPIMITFDGGYQNFYLYALPIISSYGFKPVLFLLTGVMGQDNSWDGDNNPVIMFMSWEEVAACYGDHNLQYIDLQSHTVTHPDLTTASAATRNYELTHSRELIQERFPDDPVDFFCYPYGAYNATVKSACRANGYFAAWAAGGGIETTCSDKWAIKRIPVYWDVVTDYDPAKPSSFFFTKIGDPLVVPSITINSVAYLDPATENPITQLKWGQTVKIRVIATNSGAAADVGARLMLDDNADLSDGVVYDSHTADPPQDVTAASWTGQRMFEWLWTAPIDAPTTRYTATVRFDDKFFVLGFARGSYAAFTVKSNLAYLGNARTLLDGTWVAFKGAAVSATWPDCFYIEMDSRAMGLRVEKLGHGIAVGSRINVAGKLVTKESGERCLVAGYAEVVGTARIAPVAMCNRAIGGAASGLQGGIAGSHGINNIGLLVRVWGRIESIDTENHTMVIDDGSGVDLKCAWSEGVAVDPTWTYVTLTGVSSCEKLSGQLSRLVLVTSAVGQ